MGMKLAQIQESYLKIMAFDQIIEALGLAREWTEGLKKTEQKMEEEYR